MSGSDRVGLTQGDHDLTISVESFPQAGPGHYRSRSDIGAVGFFLRALTKATEKGGNIAHGFFGLFFLWDMSAIVYQFQS
jgi:hypothetical protein